jgi:glucose-6-phosphate 1-dehydrogenase
VQEEGMSERQDRAARTKKPAKGETVAVAPPCAMVIFGAGGDLTKRLIMPVRPWF